VAEEDDKVGLTYKFSDNVIFDGAAKFGFNDAMPGWNIAIGMSITLGTVR